MDIRHGVSLTPPLIRVRAWLERARVLDAKYRSEIFEHARSPAPPRCCDLPPPKPRRRDRVTAFLRRVYSRCAVAQARSRVLHVLPSRTRRRQVLHCPRLRSRADSAAEPPAWTAPRARALRR